MKVSLRSFDIARGTYLPTISYLTRVHQEGLGDKCTQILINLVPQAALVSQEHS